MPLHKHILFITLLLFIQTSAWAQTAAPQPVQISYAKKTNDPIWVGQRVTVIVEVLSETFFSGPTVLSLPDIPGAVFYKPEERALVSSKTVNSQTYSVQRHELSFYPQRAGNFEIPSFKVRFGIAGTPGQPAVENTENTQSLKLSVKMPPGAEHLAVLISATDLKVSESWQPQPSGTVTVGDAFKRTITFLAPDMPGMVFPAINFPETEGLKLYQSRALVNDKINRGSLVGERIDQLTYLCEKAGSYALPAIVIPWWDLNNKKMQKIILPAVHFEVEENPSATSLPEENPRPSAVSPWKIVSSLSAFFLILAAILFRYKNPLLQNIATWKIQRQQSESAYFKKIANATSPAQTLNAINQWLARTDASKQTLTLHAFASEQNDPELISQIDALQAAVVSQNHQWDSAALIRTLRKSRHSTATSRSSPALKPLNPQS